MMSLQVVWHRNTGVTGTVRADVMDLRKGKGRPRTAETVVESFQCQLEPLCVRTSEAFMWVLVDLQTSVTRALRNLPAEQSTSASVVIVRELLVGVIRLNLTFDKVCQPFVKKPSLPSSLSLSLSLSTSPSPSLSLSFLSLALRLFNVRR